ncbi:hypothetical protein ACFVVQ_12240 [Paenibacillus chitinolyticus]|uniref:hypothetical protein n=1 Tax=Paenibacillus chitinolyticus TaxID=79263 RepID=UPI0036DBBF6F
MAVFKVKYLKECVNIMVVEASSKEEARSKHEKYDCLVDYEIEGISETILDISEVD